MTLAALLAGCIPAGASAPVVKPDSASGGQEVHPLRIVSANPCTDAILAEVAGPGQLVAVSRYSHDPRATSLPLDVARRFPATTGMVEDILPFRPDVVVSGTYMPPATVAALRHLGIRVELMPIAATVDESLAQVRQLAALTGRQQQGEALVAAIEHTLSAAAPANRHAPVPAVVWLSGGIVPGNDTLIADLMRRTGFINFTGSKGMKQADTLPLEELIADPPQVILTAGDTHGEEDRMLGHPALAHLEHTRRERLDPSLLYCGGPTIARTAQRLAEIRRSLEAGDRAR